MVVVVNYGIGNLDSIVRAFRKAESDAVVSSAPEDIERASGIVLPGVGSFAEAMENLNRHRLLPALNRRVIEQGIPTLGICLGFQMFTRHSEEGGGNGLGWIDGETKRFAFGEGEDRYKVPHLGWNDVVRRAECPLFNGIPPEASFYFAHSYYVDCRDESIVVATTDYGHPYVSAVRRGNLFGTQFHPEKSHASGLRMIRNFVECCDHA